MLNGAQMHEINKFIGTATTLAVVGCVVYSHIKEQRLNRQLADARSRMTLIDSALDARDRSKFYKIVNDGLK